MIKSSFPHVSMAINWGYPPLQLGLPRGAVRNVHFDLHVVMLPEESLAPHTVHVELAPFHRFKHVENLNHHHVPIIFPSSSHHVPHMGGFLKSGYPRIIHLNRLFNHEPSSYGGISIYGNSHMSNILSHLVGSSLSWGSPRAAWLISGKIPSRNG